MENFEGGGDGGYRFGGEGVDFPHTGVYTTANSQGYDSSIPMHSYPHLRHGAQTSMYQSQGPPVHSPRVADSQEVPRFPYPQNININFNVAPLPGLANTEFLQQLIGAGQQISNRFPNMTHFNSPLSMLHQPFSALGSATGSDGSESSNINFNSLMAPPTTSSTTPQSFMSIDDRTLINTLNVNIPTTNPSSILPSLESALSGLSSLAMQANMNSNPYPSNTQQQSVIHSAPQSLTAKDSHVQDLSQHQDKNTNYEKVHHPLNVPTIPRPTSFGNLVQPESQSSHGQTGSSQSNRSDLSNVRASSPAKDVYSEYMSSAYQRIEDRSSGQALEKMSQMSCQYQQQPSEDIAMSPFSQPSSSIKSENYVNKNNMQLAVDQMMSFTSANDTTSIDSVIHRPLFGQGSQRSPLDSFNQRPEFDSSNQRAAFDSSNQRATFESTNQRSSFHSTNQNENHIVTSDETKEAAVSRLNKPQIATKPNPCTDTTNTSKPKDETPKANNTDTVKPDLNVNDDVKPNTANIKPGILESGLNLSLGNSSEGVSESPPDKKPVHFLFMGKLQQNRCNAKSLFQGPTDIEDTVSHVKDKVLDMPIKKEPSDEKSSVSEQVRHTDLHKGEDGEQDFHSDDASASSRKHKHKKQRRASARSDTSDGEKKESLKMIIKLPLGTAVRKESVDEKEDKDGEEKVDNDKYADHNDGDENHCGYGGDDEDDDEGNGEMAVDRNLDEEAESLAVSVLGGDALLDTPDERKFHITSSLLSPSLKKVRRSPTHPFAITSPSFNEASAKAVMTTMASGDATIVTITITSKGSKRQLMPRVVNSAAAAGGIVSIANLGGEDDAEKESALQEVKSDRTSIMSKLWRRKERKKESGDLDTLAINIKIDDTQLITHGEQKRWQCKLCPKSYTTKHNLVTHILDHSGIKPHLCMMCGKYFKQLSHLNTHMLTHDNVKPHICDVCDKGFTQISHLKRHQAVHLDSKPYICDICHRGFAYPSELRSHKDKHVPGKDKCVDCGEEFTCQKDLRCHMATHEHRSDLICKHCHRVFRFPSQLKDHMITHAGARPFICTECGMDFMKEHHLKAHFFTHSGLKPYACPECGRSFNQRANMSRHMLIHNAERAFKCEVCDKTFTQPQTLKAHMVVHADKKPYSCKFCGKQFGRLHNLQGHLHMHNNSKPYICFCGSSFTLKGNLNRHKKVKHGLNESTESMEEDAINFLSNMSEQTKSDKEDNDTSREDEQELSSPDKSPKKGRKSVPRKIQRRKAGDSGESGAELEDEDDVRGELDEAESTSRFFERLVEGDNSNDTSSDKRSRRKRKGEVCYRVKDADEFQDFEDYGSVFGLDATREHLEAMYGENVQANSDEEEDEETDQNEQKRSEIIAEKLKGFQRAKKAKLSTGEETVLTHRRKRPRKEIQVQSVDKDCTEVGEQEDDVKDDEELDQESTFTSSRAKKNSTKGAKLDSLASKLRQVRA